MVALNRLKENTDCPKVFTTGMPRTYSTASLDMAASALPYWRIFSAIRFPVITDMTAKPRNTGTRLSSPSRQSKAISSTSSPTGVAIAPAWSGSWWARYVSAAPVLS